jgi:hypothetical protein
MRLLGSTSPYSPSSRDNRGYKENKNANRQRSKLAEAEASQEDEKGREK